MTREKRAWQRALERAQSCVKVSECYGKIPNDMYLGSPTPPNRFFIREGASTTSLSAFGSVDAINPPSTISLNSCATVSYELSILLASNGDPKKSSKASATRWRNSSTWRGSVSVELGQRKSKLS